MLIEKRTIVAINDVITVKLVSGEEIVGKLIEQNSESITLAKPVTVALHAVSDKQMGVATVLTSNDGNAFGWHPLQRGHFAFAHRDDEYVALTLRLAGDDRHLRVGDEMFGHLDAVRGHDLCQCAHVVPFLLS